MSMNDAENLSKLLGHLPPAVFREFMASKFSLVTLSSPTLSDWPASARLYPARLARLTDAVQVPYHTAAIAEASVRFEIEPATIAAVPGASLYRGIEVFDQPHNWTAQRPIQYARKTQRLDYTLGAVAIDDASGLPQTQRTQQVLMRTRAEIIAWRGWLAARHLRPDRRRDRGGHRDQRQLGHV
jgi:hypothetical protein